MPTIASGNDALRALHASLASEREWRNIQHTVAAAFTRVVVALEAQTHQLDAVMSRLERLETSQAKFPDAQMALLHATIAKETAQCIHSGHEQLMERVCAHVDARLVAQSAKIEETSAIRWAEIQKSEKLKHQEMEQVIRQQVGKDVDDMLKRQRLQDGSNVDLLDQLKKLDKNMRSLEKEFTMKWSAGQRELATALQSKASVEDVTQCVEATIASRQVQFAAVSELDHIRALVQELQQSQTRMREDMDHVHRTLERPGATTETEQMKSHLHELLGIVEKMQNEQTALKALVVGSCNKPTDQESDTKQAVLRLHEAVKSVRRSVETVAKRAEMEALSEQLAVIRKQLRSEIYQARYIWKEGRPTAKQTIPWSSQAVNSSADVFVWQRSQPDVVTAMIPGLYHLQAAFFTRFSPILQVLVNGEPALLVAWTEEIIDRNENNACVVNQASPSPSEPTIRRRRLHHSGGDLVGVEITAFLALPARAAVSISYDVDERAQGFLNLRKL